MGISNILCHKQNPKRGPLTVPSLAPCRIFLVNSYLRIELPIFLAHPIQFVRGPGNPVISYHRYQCPPGVSQHSPSTPDLGPCTSSCWLSYPYVPSPLYLPVLPSLGKYSANRSSQQKNERVGGRRKPCFPSQLSPGLYSLLWKTASSPMAMPSFMEALLCSCLCKMSLAWSLSPLIIC